MAADLRSTPPTPGADTPRGRGELDDVTLGRAQRGDHAAFRVLVETYQDRVWQLCWRMLAPVGLGHRADDLAQETLVRVFRGLAGFDRRGPARLSTWILTVATRRALSELARVRPRPMTEDAALAALEAAAVDAGPSPGAASLRRELGAQLATAIAALPDGARAVLLLRDLYELEYAEIADALELEVGTVKSRLARARAAVRARLQGDPP